MEERITEEKTNMESDQKRGRHKKVRKLLYFIAVIGFFCLLAVCVFNGFRLYQHYGRERLNEYALRPNGPDILTLSERIGHEGNRAEEQSLELREGQLVYRGKIYEYNDNLLTFLIMGIDSTDGIGKEKVSGMAGQADMIMLLILDEAAKTLKMINISRDIMVNVQTYDTNGIFAGEEELQIALQYAYGDGLEKSARLMEEAVSNLFYGIPIHGYGALDMSSITLLNDAVGGVEVSVIEDLSWIFPSLELGRTVTLMGEEALVYVQYRDTSQHESNNRRIMRQKQYLTGYFQRIKEKTKANITFPLQLYRKARDYAITSITMDQAAYLSTAVLGCTFSAEDMLSVEGVIEQPGIHEEFRVKEDALYDLIINVFYTVVA